jgi:hypothetical protein
MSPRLRSLYMTQTQEQQAHADITASQKPVWHSLPFYSAVSSSIPTLAQAQVRASLRSLGESPVAISILHLRRRAFIRALHKVLEVRTGAVALRTPFQVDLGKSLSILYPAPRLWTTAAFVFRRCSISSCSTCRTSSVSCWRSTPSTPLSFCCTRCVAVTHFSWTCCIAVEEAFHRIFCVSMTLQIESSSN